MSLRLTESTERPSPYLPYRKTLLTRDQIRILSQRKPLRLVTDTFLCWAAILSAWIAVAMHPEWWVLLLAIPVIGTRYYGLFLIGHDGLHRLLAGSQKSNDLYTDLLVLGPIGAITRINKHNHLLHHQHLATSKDPDRHKHCCYNKSRKLEYLFFFSGFANLLPAASNVFLRKTKAGIPLISLRDIQDSGSSRSVSPVASYSVRDLAILAAWQVALIGGLSIFVAWWAYPVLWLLPVYVFTYLGDLVRSFLEHSHPESDDKADKHRLVTFVSNPIERLFFAPMSMNYHAAHHLWTSIPYYNLAAADKVMRQHSDMRDLTWRGSYLGYMLRYYLALPLMECRLTNERIEPAESKAA